MSFSLAASNSRPEPAVAVRAVAERALGFFRQGLLSLLVIAELIDGR